MKKVLILLVSLISSPLLSQYVYTPSYYDFEEAAHSIMHGNLAKWSEDTVRLSFDTKRGEPKVSYTTSTQAEHKIAKYLGSGECRMGGSTNRGYTFTIVVVDFKRRDMVISKVVLTVNPYTQKVHEVEVERHGLN